ncbi:MAG: TlpA family protein disulfide reductase [Flavobacteriaceae bacterium]|nr:TlpA family protein disulfide reductase [Flavobacteriaceae bacterium]
MKKFSLHIILIALFLVAQKIQAQQVKLKDSLFSEALAANFMKFKYETKKAYDDHDFERGDFLFDSLVENVLKSKYFDDFKVKKLNGVTVSLNNYFKKPVFLITYASWCITSQGEIPAINALAKKYSDKIDFVVLYWDNKNNARKASKQYDKNVNVVYINEVDNTFSSEVINLKHTFGFPTSFYIDSENRVMDIKRVNKAIKINDTYLKAYTENYNFFVDGLSSLLINGEIVKEHLAGK